LINEVHTGPIIYIAKVFSFDTDYATKWMIILIMFVFDPLAVALTIAFNTTIEQRQSQPTHNKNIITEPLHDSTIEKIVTKEKIIGNMRKHNEV